MFLNLTCTPNKHGKQNNLSLKDKIRHHAIIIYNRKTLQNEIPPPFYLQHYEITMTLLENFSQKPNAAESLQMTSYPYIKGAHPFLLTNTQGIHRNIP